MRIIAGEFRGRVLLAPDGQQTRPVTDRAKQSIFDTLGDAFAQSIVYDVFAGTGSFGFEALSRGATHAVFFESHRATLALLKKNIEVLKVADRTTIITTDVFKWQSDNDAHEAGLICLDPPYRFLREKPQQVRELAGRLSKKLLPEGVLLFRHDASDALSLPALRMTELKHFGSMAVEFMSRE